MDYLNNPLRDTDALQEYFIPPNKLPQFVDGLRSIVKGNGANLINVTIRIARKDEITTLNYAKQACVPTCCTSIRNLTSARARFTRRRRPTCLISHAAWTAPTIFPTSFSTQRNIFVKRTPRVDEFFATKRIYDPDELLTNKCYEQYGK
jgi:hypothetical protein